MSRQAVNKDRRASRWLAPVIACLGMLVPLAAQRSAAGPNKGLTQSLPTLATMAQALLTQDYTIEQYRRFRDENGNLVTTRERLEVAADGSPRPPFELTFLGVVGEPTGSQLHAEWQQNYDRYGALFVRKGGFAVRDLQVATANYALHDFGQVVRAGRIARRMVVFPISGGADKPVWVVDIDALTSVPLFVLEFDRKFHVVAEMEAVQFSDSVQSITPVLPSTNVTPVNDFAAAQAHLGSPAGIVDPDVMILQDYAVQRIEVHDDPINGRQKLVSTYSDGIDEFTVVQALNSPDPFAGMPASATSPSGGTTHTIGRFRDPAVSALVFWDDNVAFQIAGRGSLVRLDELARRVYLQALSN